MKKIIVKIKLYRKNHSRKETIDWLILCTKHKFNKIKKHSKDYKTIRINKSETKNLIVNNRKKIFIFANIPYYDIGGGQRSSQIAKTFYKMGYPVYYFYAYHSNESKINNIDMPMVMHVNLKKIKTSSFKEIVDENSLCIFESPSKLFDKYIDIVKEKKAKLVYENIDNWETILGKEVYDKEILEKIIKNADMLIGTAKPLVKQLESYCKKFKEKKEITYLANAVDDELFCSLNKYEKPKDLINGNKTLIYYGTLWGEWFDWNIIFEIAKSNPKYQINLIGDYKGIVDIVDKAPKNIKFLGIKKQLELPAYLQHSDYALLPFKPGEISDYVSPLKIFEYIAMNKIVLSTPLPDIKEYPNVFFGNTGDEWNKLLNKKMIADENKLNKFVNENNWYNRVTKILNELYPLEKNKCDKKFYNNISIVVLNYNNKEIIDKCINSLLEFNKRYLYEIIVVDNKSRDGSVEMLEVKYHNKIKIIKNSKNGCSSGRNLGVKNATKEYIMFLDSDQWALNDYWIEPYFEVMEKAPNVGLIGWAAGWFNKYGKAYHVVDNFAYRSMPQSALCRNDIGYLGSGGMFIKKDLFNKIEGFDLYYDPTCYEDTDLSLKVRDEGFEIYYCPYLGIMHLPHQTTKSGSENHRKLMNEKQLYFTKKWTEKNNKLLKYIK